MEATHPIQVVSRRTGLSADVLRAWEKRYSAVNPTRSPTGRRLYSDGDVERLLLLRRATLSGRSIGQVAGLSNDDLRDLVSQDEQEAARAPRAAPPAPGAATARGVEAILRRCMESVRDLDASGLEETLIQAEVELSRLVLIEQVLTPLMHSIGDLWADGALRVAHEHLTSAVVRSFLGVSRDVDVSSAPGPRLVVTTPAGQIHELGAILVGATASMEGWRVTYLGPNLPAAEIAVAARDLRPRAVALSIVYPTDDPRLADEIRRLRGHLPDDTAILIGGSGAPAYAGSLDSIDVVHLPDMPALGNWLREARK